MAKLEILHYPDTRLRTRAEPVEDVNDDIRQLVDDMFETMYDAPGIGLAATQVDRHIQLIVIDISETKDQPLCLINPMILQSYGIDDYEEGCLSVPGVYESVERAESIDIRALDKHGEPFEMNASGLLAICIQHEMDHLQGKLFVDYLSRLKQGRIKKKLQKTAKMEL